jgi:transketolase
MPLFTLEEHFTTGGLGSAVAEVIAESGRGIVFERFGLPDAWPHTVGSQTFLRNAYGLNGEALLPRILKRLGRAA